MSVMPLFLGHRTAEFLLNRQEVESLSPSVDQGLEHCWASRTDMSHIDLSLLEGIPQPYDVLVSSPNEIRHWKGVTCHLCKDELPSGSFIELAQDLFVASPALCLVQRSQALTLAQSVVIADRLCSTYALDKRRRSGIRERKPLVTLEDLKAYLDRCSRLRGIEQARRSLTLAREGSASPMETVSRLVLCLPRRLRGLGLSVPLMNYEKTLSEAAQRLVDKGFIRIDLYWENYGFGIEYQGKYAHSSLSSIEGDIARQLAAERMGIELQMMTIKQLRNQAQRMEIARKIARRIGEHIPSDASSWAANQKLVEELLSTPGA